MRDFGEEISVEFARREHGVIIDSTTLEVDEAATRRQRASRMGGQP